MKESLNSFDDSNFDIECEVTLFIMEDVAQREMTPEQKLLKGMLKMAMLDLLNPERFAPPPQPAKGRRRRRVGRPTGRRVVKPMSEFANALYQATLVWVEEDKPDEPLSFVYCCEGLGIEPGGLRKRLLAEVKKRLH